jgi:hypothetical protein
MGKTRYKILPGSYRFQNDTSHRARDPDTGIFPDTQPFEIRGMQLDDRTGIEVFLGSPACFHAHALLNGTARDNVDGDFTLCHSVASIPVSRHVLLLCKKVSVLLPEYGYREYDRNRSLRITKESSLAARKVHFSFSRPVLLTSIMVFHRI